MSPLAELTRGPRVETAVGEAASVDETRSGGPFAQWTSLWTVWISAIHSATNGLRSGEDSDGAEAGSAPLLELVTGNAVELLECLGHRLAQQLRGAVVVGLRAAFGLRHDRVDHAELEAVDGIRLEPRRRLLRLRGVAPEDRRATLGRD